jgi:hypothetical protein
MASRIPGRHWRARDIEHSHPPQPGPTPALSPSDLNVSHILLAGHRSFCGKQPKSYGFCSAVRSSGGSQPSETVLASRFLPRFSTDFPVATVSSQKDMGKDQPSDGERGNQRPSLVFPSPPPRAPRGNLRYCPKRSQFGEPAQNGEVFSLSPSEGERAGVHWH